MPAGNRADRSRDVALVRCADYDRATVGEAVNRSLALLGGLSRFVHPGERVLIKPNLLKGRPPADAVTTHPEIVRAVIRVVRSAGAIPLVGDSPGLGDLRSVCEKAGILDVLEEEGVELAAFEDPVTVKNNGQFQRFEIARAVADADVVINLPKLKTHGMTVLTGAVKNLFGCVPGRRKVQWHFNTGVDHGSFMRMLVELAHLIRPRLTIMDAVIAMEGNGPGSGDPRAVGVLLAGGDPVAVDAVSAAIIGVGPSHLPVLRAAAAAGVGEPDMDRIRVLGEPINAVRITEFAVPAQEHIEWRLPEWMRRSLKDAITTRPVIHQEQCVRCGICERDCPQKTIFESGGKMVIDYRRCIRCFCCQEFCPQGAITVGKGWALRLMVR